jgi:DNA modification methylase
MDAWHQDARAAIYHGDCLTVLAELPDASVDAVVTDPPYELGFMGKGWDASGIAYRVDLWAEALRVLKPGGHLLAFGGTRTWHRLACAIEDAGFEVRDSIAWMYGSGFPKSLDVSKAIDKARNDDSEWRRVGQWLKAQREAAGFTRQTIAPLLSGHKNLESAAANMSNWENGLSFPTWERWEELRALIGFDAEMDVEVWRLNGRKGSPGEAWGQREVIGMKKSGIADKAEGPRYTIGASKAVDVPVTAPATDAAREWSGWGTALKPAHEPIAVARKPLVGTVAANVLEHGTGALNIDACRIGTEVVTSSGQTGMNKRRFSHGTRPVDYGKGHAEPRQHTGRWPANVVLDEDQAAELDRQSGISKSNDPGTTHVKALGWGHSSERRNTGYAGDVGGASRFFYVAKAPAKERPKVDGTAHPTVKPLTLMRWLCRLVTPPDGVILEPFAGSGTTVEAALLEGFRVVAIEREADYLPLIQARLDRVAATEPEDEQLTLDASA